MYECMSGQLFNMLLIVDTLSLRSSGTIFLHLPQNRSPFVLLSSKYSTLMRFDYYLLFVHVNKNAICLKFLVANRNLIYTYYIVKVRWLNVSYFNYNLNAFIMFNALFCLLVYVKILINLYFCPILGVPYILLSAMLIFLNHYYGYA